MISVCLASYNGDKFIAEQIVSITEQLGTNDEVIISDDGSTDSTIDIVNQFALKDSRVRLIFGPQQGLIKNFESAILQAKGDIIFLSDQDDIWTENKVASVSSLLDDNLMVISDCYIVDENGNILENSFFDINGVRNSLVGNFLKNSYLGCCMAFRRDLITKALPFPNNIPMHDWWLGLCASSFGNVYFLPSKLVKYRRHGGNASPTSEKSRYSFYTKFKFRALLLKGLLGRVLF